MSPIHWLISSLGTISLLELFLQQPLHFYHSFSNRLQLTKFPGKTASPTLHAIDSKSFRYPLIWNNCTFSSFVWITGDRGFSRVKTKANPMPTMSFLPAASLMHKGGKKWQTQKRSSALPEVIGIELDVLHPFSLNHHTNLWRTLNEQDIQKRQNMCEKIYFH